MNDKIFYGLSDFESVWRRVEGKASPAEEASLGINCDFSDTGALLLRLIDGKAFSAERYRALSLGTRGTRAAVLSRLCSDETRHLHALRLERFLLTGSDYVPTGTKQPPCMLLKALRECYLSEASQSLEYATHAARAEQAHMKRLFENISADCASHRESLRALIGSALR